MAEDFIPNAAHDENFIPGETELSGAELFQIVRGVHMLYEHKDDQLATGEAYRLLEETLGSATDSETMRRDWVQRLVAISAYYGRTGQAKEAADLAGGLSHARKALLFSAYADGKRKAAD